MRPFVVTLALALTVVVGVNAAATWDQRRREERHRAAAARLGPGVVMAFEGQVDERRFQQARLEVIPRARLVAFGSSRVRDVSAEVAGAAPGEFYNLGMSAATVEDYIALWSLLVRRGNAPDVAVFSVDAWVFSGSHEQVRWLALAPEVARFLDEAPGARGIALLGGRFRYLWYRAKEFLSFSVLRASMRDLDRAIAGRKQRGDDLLQTLSGGLVAEGAVAGRQAIRADGSVIRPAEMRERPPDRVREEVVRHVGAGPYGLVDFRWDPTRAARLERLWRDMRAAGVRLVVYMPPYHPAAWALLRKDSRYAAVLDKTASFLTELSARAQARFLDASDPSSIPCAEEEFYDAQHAGVQCLARLWSRLLPGR